jgi:DNA-directed RNA polymerase specialized sigma24 family protein
VERRADFLGLLERSRKGDQEALALLVQQYEREVRLMARVLLGPALRPYLDSVDLVQSVHRSMLFGLHRGRFQFNSAEDLLALALTMVRRKVARQWRHLQRQQRLDGGWRGVPDVLASASGSGDDPARAAQLNDQIRDLCRHLSATEVTIIEMRLAGYAATEIGLRQRLREAGVFDDWF